MYVFLDQITHRYPGVTSPALAGVSLFVRSGEIAAVVGLPGAGKSTLLRIIAAHGDNVLIGSADHREPGDVKPGPRAWMALLRSVGYLCAGVEAGRMARRADPALRVPEYGA